MIKFLQTPTPTKKIVLGGLLLIVCVFMVISLIPGVGSGAWSGGGSGALAKVGDQEVTLTEVQNLARQIGRRQFPKGYPQEFLPFLMQNAANSLILQKAMIAEAERMGLSVGDAELRDELRQGNLGQQLFPNGNFIGQDEYENFVAQNFSLTKAKFEEAVKTDLVIRKLRSAIAAGVTVADADVQQEFQRQHSRVKLAYAVLTTSDLEKQIKPTDTELKAFYDNNKARYENSVPEKRKARYVVVDINKLRDQAKPQIAPADIEQFYKSHQDDFRVPDQVKASHILIKTPPPGPDGKVDEKGVEDARKKAQDILNKLRGGANFEELAKKDSQDTPSATKGGSLGFVRRGATVAEFEQAAFSQPVGKIGDLVRSAFGFHIIRVDEKQEAHLKPLGEVREAIVTTLAQQRAVAAADALVAKLLSQARTAGLESAAGSNHLAAITSDWFARTDALPGVGSSPEFMGVAFNQQKGAPPESVKLLAGSYVVLQVTDIKPAATPAFEEIRARVETDFKGQRAGALLAQKTQELADRAHAEHDLKKAAQELGATVKTSELVTPNDQVPDLGAMSGPGEVAFSLKVGEISGAVSAPPNGAVFQVLEKQEGAPAEFTKAKDEIRDTLLDRKRNDRLNLFVTDLRARMEKSGKIKINQAEWKRVMNARGET